MTDEEAIKYLQQLYHNGGHCWLDEQRIKAINMAIDALKGEPVSEDLEDEITDYINKHFSECEDGVLLSDAHSSELQYTDVADIARHFAKWQKEQMMANGVDGVARPDDGEVWCDLNSFNFKDGDKVKVILINED